MSWTPSSPVTGGPQTGFTSPTYTLTADTPPTANGKQYAITTLGGAGNTSPPTGASTPFTLSFFKPAVVKTATLDSDGKVVSAPMNVYKQITRRAVLVNVAQAQYRIMLITTTVEIPAMSESVDAVAVRAGLSCHIGALWAQSSGIGDTVVQGVL